MGFETTADKNSEFTGMESTSKTYNIPADGVGIIDLSKQPEPRIVTAEQLKIENLEIRVKDLDARVKKLETQDELEEKIIDLEQKVKKLEAQFAHLNSRNRVYF